MRKNKIYFIILFFVGITNSFSQIDYKALVRNLEDITYETNLEDYFKGLRYDADQKKFEDERFLRLYGVVIDKVEFRRGWSDNLSIYMDAFHKKEDYETLKKKLLELYGEPEIEEDDYYISNVWVYENKEITLHVSLENGDFKEFRNLSIELRKE